MSDRATNKVRIFRDLYAILMFVVGLFFPPQKQGLHVPSHRVILHA